MFSVLDLSRVHQALWLRGLKQGAKHHLLYLVSVVLNDNLAVWNPTFLNFAAH